MGFGSCGGGEGGGETGLYVGMLFVSVCLSVSVKNVWLAHVFNAHE